MIQAKIYMSVMASVSRWCYSAGNVCCILGRAGFTVIHGRFRARFRLAGHLWFFWGCFDVVSSLFAHTDGHRFCSLISDIVGCGWWGTARLLLVRRRFDSVVRWTVTCRAPSASRWPITATSRTATAAGVISLFKWSLRTNAISWWHAVCKCTTANSSSVICKNKNFYPIVYSILSHYYHSCSC